jgi:hypothetical protein
VKGVLRFLAPTPITPEEEHLRFKNRGIAYDLPRTAPDSNWNREEESQIRKLRDRRFPDSKTPSDFVCRAICDSPGFKKDWRAKLMRLATGWADIEDQTGILEDTGFSVANALKFLRPLLIITALS